MSERNTIGIGVIGLGHWGPHHVRVFSHVRGAEVVAAADPSADRRRHLENLYRGLTLVADPMDVLNRPDVDAVVIATPARTHFELAAAAFEAGKHVLLEKPIAIDVAAAERVVRAAQESGRVLAVAEEYRLSPLVRAAHRAIKEGLLGRVTLVQVSAAGPHRPPQD